MWGGPQAHNCVAQHTPEHTRAACDCVVHSAQSLELSHLYMARDTEGAMSTRGLVAMTSAQHAEGRQFDPGRVYATSTASLAAAGPWHACFKAMRHCHAFYHRLMMLSRGPSARRDQRQRATGAVSGTACGPHRAHGSPDSTPCHAQSVCGGGVVVVVGGGAGTQLRGTAHL